MAGVNLERIRLGTNSARALRLFAIGALAVAICLLSGSPARAGLTVPAGGSALAKTYHIQGGGSVAYSYTSPEGQARLQTCDVDLMPQWSFTFDGQLDTSFQTMQGTIDVPKRYQDLLNQNNWTGNEIQCGPPTDPATGQGHANWVNYTYAYIATGGSFTGSYQSNGTFHIQGTINLAGGFKFLLCTLPTKIVKCDDTVGADLDAASNLANDLGRASGPTATLPNTAVFKFQNQVVSIDGQIVFEPNESGGANLIPRMSGKLDLPGSSWFACCEKHSGDADSGFSDIDISGTPSS